MFVSMKKACEITGLHANTLRKYADEGRIPHYRTPNAELITDIGSGINFKRKGLQAILERAMCGECITLVISYRDRLAKFGFDLIEWIITKSGGQIVVLNQIDTSPTEELTADLMAIITVFSARLHGLRQYKNKIKTDLAEANKDTKTTIS